jgi:hypothetical protein
MTARSIWPYSAIITDYKISLYKINTDMLVIHIVSEQPLLPKGRDFSICGRDSKNETLVAVRQAPVHCITSTYREYVNTLFGTNRFPEHWRNKQKTEDMWWNLKPVTECRCQANLFPVSYSGGPGDQISALRLRHFILSSVFAAQYVVQYIELWRLVRFFHFINVGLLSVGTE